MLLSLVIYAASEIGVDTQMLVSMSVSASVPALVLALALKSVSWLVYGD